MAEKRKPYEITVNEREVVVIIPPHLIGGSIKNMWRDPTGTMSFEQVAMCNNKTASLKTLRRIRPEDLERYKGMEDIAECNACFAPFRVTL